MADSLKRYLVAGSLLVASVAHSANNRDACSGDWYGMLDVTTDDYLITTSLHRAEDGQCVGTLQIPERDIVDAPIREARIDSSGFSFSVLSRGQTLQLSGLLSEDGQLVSGLVKFPQFSRPFKLTRDSSLIAQHGSTRPLALRDVSGLPSDRAAFGTTDHSEIQYITLPSHDAVRILNEKIATGDIKLVFDSRQGYLPSVLSALDITVDSQMVVYSKTSVQARLINPRNPRALYFRDDVTVGYIHNAPFLEFVALDPSQGVIFYTLDQIETAHPQFVRRNTCLSCHLSHNTMDVPGILLRSVITDEAGRTYDQFGDHHPDDRTEIADRWGGWYVTGNSGSMKHLGNALLHDPKTTDGLIDMKNLSVKSLEDRFDTTAYSSHFSDIAALMVFEHQAHMTNLLVRMGWDARAAVSQAESTDPKLADQLLTNDAHELVDYMLFVDEAPLTNPIEPSSTFAKSFAWRGPYDRQGRTLRELDLQKRLFRYPCSYMIYSDAFNALPSSAKQAIYRRVWQILSGQAKEPKYSRLSQMDRRAVREILIDTKEELPRYFK